MNSGYAPGLMLARAALLAGMLALAAGLAARRARLLTRLVRLGRPVDRRTDLPVRLAREGTHVLGQRKLFQRLVPGMMHALIFWGFLVLLSTILEVGGQIVDPDLELPWIGGTRWLGLVQDAFAAGVLVGLALALAIRLGQRPERFVGSHQREAFRILGLIFWIVLTLFVGRGARIALGLAPDWWWTPVSTAVSRLFDGTSEGWIRAWMWTALWAHATLILAFGLYLGYSKHLHIATSAINVFFSNTKPRGTLTPLRIDLERMETEDVALGAATITDLTWKESLDLYACTECGRCQAACPAWNTGKPLSPKLLVMDLRDHLLEEGPRLLRARDEEGDVEATPLVPDVVDDDVVWACTTCGACMQECPVDIEHIDTIVDLRRNLVMAESRFPAEAGTLLRNLEATNNPWGMPQGQRADWANDRGVRVLGDGDRAPEYLYWVGCAGSFDDRAKAISRAVVEVLERASVSFAILGPRELCTGDPARRIGHEYLFQTFAERNIETMKTAGVTKVIANCPHCFNTLKNEYPQMGGNFRVQHYTEFLAELALPWEGIFPNGNGVKGQVSYHDSCYLGRYNRIYQQPRQLLRQARVSTVEMRRREENSFCCGGGGGQMWLETDAETRINQQRLKDAVSVKADVVATACPYCLLMFDDAIRSKGLGETMQVLDVAEVLEKQFQ